MVQISSLILILFWLIFAVYQVFNWTYWWQVKEYRFDRFWIFFKTKDGREKLDIKENIVKLFSLLLGYNNILIPFLIFFYLDLKLLKILYDKKLRIPVLTQRAKRLLITSGVGVILTLSFINYLGLINTLILGEVFLVLLPYIGILWTIPIVNKVKREEILKAKDKLKRVNPIVIGVTGSYGKTTTKEFITHLLSQKYHTAKTEGSENTEFGIARKTFKNINKNTRFYIVEMGAYKEGEIEKLTDIVNPQIGVITGIEEQHLSLFGSLENIKKTKFELIESLPKGGIAIFNFNNKYCQELYKKAAKLQSKPKIMSYMVKEKSKRNNFEKTDVLLKILSANSNEIKFKVTYKGEEKILTTRLRGLHFLENLACAILIAKYYNVSWDDIKKGLRSITLPENTMNFYNLKSGCFVIDDTYNSTPLAFESALRYLSFFKKKKKIVFTSGIIELGKKSNFIHKRLGIIMSEKIDKVILTNPDFYGNIKNGLGKSKDILILLNNTQEDEIRKILQFKDSVVLLEGRLPLKLMEIIREMI